MLPQPVWQSIQRAHGEGGIVEETRMNAARVVEPLTKSFDGRLDANGINEAYGPVARCAPAPGP